MIFETFPDDNKIDVFDGWKKEWYLTEDQIPSFLRNNSNIFNDIASKIFYNGGSLSQFGLTIKPEYSNNKITSMLTSILCSFNCKHEIKIATAAYYLNQWCDYSETTKNNFSEPVKQLKKPSTKPKKSHRIKKWV